MGAEGPASEVRSQGNYWGSLCEDSLKGASVPQLAGGRPEKSLDLLKRQETIVLGCTKKRDSFHMCPQKAEHHLSELHRRA